MKYSNRLKGIFLCLFFSTTLAQAQPSAVVTQKGRLSQSIDSALKQSVDQYKYLMRLLPKDKLPRSFENGQLLTCTPYAWISGFYPGTLFLLYADSGDSTLLHEAEERLKMLEKLQYVTNTHDLGFMMYCSYGNARRIAPKEKYDRILIQSAKSLATRYNPVVGCIKSWNNIKSLDGKTMLTYPVIIDNMMNLELLFFASRVTGDNSFRELAVRHAETTLKNHVRPDYSTYHVVNYDSTTGQVKSRETQQGFSDNSTWSRGQAWGIYGFTMTYRETKDKRFLQAAMKMADYFLKHLPQDKIPYWDFNVNQPGYTPLWKYDPNKYSYVPRDASAAAIASSALIELSGYADARSARRYREGAAAMLAALLSPTYRAEPGTNGGFLLKHSTGGFPGNAEVDVPLTYADYYFIEALTRYKKASEQGFGSHAQKMAKTK